MECRAPRLEVWFFTVDCFSCLAAESKHMVRSAGSGVCQQCVATVCGSGAWAHGSRVGSSVCGQWRVGSGAWAVRWCGGVCTGVA
eukprot:7383799-Prymnesium_polylepis.1